MRKWICFILAALLLAGCTPDSGGSTGIRGNRSSDTGNEFFDNLPDLSRVSVEEYLAYFETSPDFVVLEDYQDPRDPYSAMQEARKETIGKGVKEFYDQQSRLTGRISNSVDTLVDAWNDVAPLDQMVLLFFLPLNSMEVAWGASLTEQQPWETVRSGVQMAFSYLSDGESTVTRNAAHDYTITYTDGGVTVTDHYKADPKLGFQMLCLRDGELSQVFEYLSPREGLHIWQSQTERLVAQFQGDILVRYAYTQLLEGQPLHGMDSLLLGNGAASGRDVEAWLDWALCGKPFQAENSKTFYCWLCYDGQSLRLTSSASLFGDAPHVVIPVNG